MNSLGVSLIAVICFVYAEGASTSQFAPPPNHLVVMAKIIKIQVEPAQIKKTAINWKLAPDERYVVVAASVVKVLEAESWNKEEASKFKMEIFVKIPRKEAKIGHEIKVWIEDHQHPGSVLPRDIETSIERPWWAGPPVPPK